MQAWDTALSVTRQHRAASPGLQACKVVTLEDIGCTSHPLARSAEFSASDLCALLGAVQSVVVITGMVSAAQRQLATALRSRTYPRKKNRATPVVVGFFDGFGLWKRDTIMATFLELGAVDVIWTVSEPTAVGAREHAASTSPPMDIQVIAVGSPTLADWTSVASNSALTAEAALGAWGADAPGFRVLFIGGYGPSYNTVVEMFGTVMSLLSAAEPGWQFCLSPHPHTSCGRLGAARGALELSLLSESQRQLMRVLPVHVTTAAAACCSDVIVSQGSTAGVQALFVGKVRASSPSNCIYCCTCDWHIYYIDASLRASLQRSIYVFPEGAPTFEDVGTLSGLIPVATSAGMLAALLQQARRGTAQVLSRSLQEAGVPLDALETAATHLEVLLLRFKRERARRSTK